MEKIKTPTIIPKGWGEEIVIANNTNYCGKILAFDKDAKISMHFHMIKDETWFIYSGKFTLKTIDTETADHHTQTLNEGDVIRILPGTPHQLVCLEEGDIFEVSTQHFDNDSYRIWKGDSQNAT